MALGSTSHLLLWVLVGGWLGVQGTTAISKAASLDDCLRAGYALAAKLEIEPVVVVETPSLHILRLCTLDESVLISCYVPQGRMVTTYGPREPGCARV